MRCVAVRLVLGVWAAGCTASYPADDFLVCDENTLDLWMRPASCDQQSVDCVQSCPDLACVLRCIGVALDCGECNLAQLTACGAERGCSVELNVLVDCRNANGCVDGAACPRCATQDDGWRGCVEGVLPECACYLEVCEQ